MAVSAQTTLTVSSMLHFICSSLPKTKSSTTTTTSNKEAHIQRRACLYVLLLRKKHGGLRRAAISEAAEDRGRWGQQQPPPPSTSTTTTTSRPRRNCEHSRKDHDDKLNSSRVCCRGQPLLAGSVASLLPPSSNYGLQKSVKWDASRGHQPPDGQSLAPALLPGNDDGFSGVTFWPLMQKQQPQKKRLLEIRFSRGYS